MFLILATVFYFGAVYHKSDNLDLQSLFVCIFAIIFAVFGMVTISFVAPNLSRAAVSLDAIFGILDTEIEIDVKSS